MKNNFISKTKAAVVIALITLLFGNWVNAQSFTGVYNCASVTAGSGGTTDPTPVPTATGVTFGSLTSFGVSSNPNAGGRFSFTGWGLGATTGDNVYANLTGSLVTTQYYEITLTPSVGYSISLSSIGFRVQRSATGIRTYAVRSSIDAYAANLPASISPAPTATLTVESNNVFFWALDAATSGQNGSLITLGGAPYTNLSSPVTFRFYGWNAEASGGTFSIDDVTINGSANLTTPMPEINVVQNAANVLNNSTFNFGTTPDGLILTSNFTIENTGTAPLQVTSATFIGSSDFVVNTTLPLTISASSSATFSVTFSPTTVGTLTAAVAFENDDSDENPYTINFIGNSIAAIPEINVKRNTTNFLTGSTYTFSPILNGTSAVATFTVENIGGAALDITTGTFSGDVEYTITSDYLPPFSIPYGDFATFTITFSPATTGTYTGSFIMDNNDPDENPYTINFVGEGVAPFAEMNVKQLSASVANNSTFNFGSEAISTNTDVVFTIENAGNSDLVISTYTLSGSEFSLQGTMPTTISAGGNGNFTVRFTPSSATTFSGNISIDNNDGDENPYIINFEGTGVLAQPEINVKESGINYFNNSTFDYANRTIGTNTDAVFTLENNDAGVLAISTYTLTGSTAFSVQGSIPTSVNGNSTAIFTVRFNPATSGAQNAVLTITNNDANEANYVINLTGVGVALPAAPSLKINEIMANPVSDDDWFEIYNAGTTTVNLSGLYVSNSSLTKYQFPAGSSTIAAGSFVQVKANNGSSAIPLEANFTIANSDKVYLYSYDSNTIVDTVSVFNAVSGQSYGRKTDGGSEFVSYTTATPGATNTAGVEVVSVQEIVLKSLVLYPNPAKSNFIISFENKNEKTFSYKVMDVSGREVANKKIDATTGVNAYAVDVTALTQGLYFVECVIANKKITHKIIVE